MNACTRQQARAAKRKAAELFLAIGAVAGVGITRIGEGYGLKVNLEHLPDSPLPTDVDGVPLRVEVVGAIRKREPGDGR
jgi:hypothetical protein